MLNVSYNDSDNNQNKEVIRHKQSQENRQTNPILIRIMNTRKKQYHTKEENKTTTKKPDNSIKSSCNQAAKTIGKAKQTKNCQTTTGSRTTAALTGKPNGRKYTEGHKYNKSFRDSRMSPEDIVFNERRKEFSCLDFL